MLQFDYFYESQFLFKFSEIHSYDEHYCFCEQCYENADKKTHRNYDLTAVTKNKLANLMRNGKLNCETFKSYEYIVKPFEEASEEERNMVKKRDGVNPFKTNASASVLKVSPP